MHCFTHNASAAIGICKFCGKGLCPACATDTGFGLACRDSCEERVETMGRMIAQNRKYAKMANAHSRSMSIFGIVMGLLFLGFGGLAYIKGIGYAAWFLLGMGALFLGHALVRLTADRVPEHEPSRDESSGR